MVLNYNPFICILTTCVLLLMLVINSLDLNIILKFSSLFLEIVPEVLSESFCIQEFIFLHYFWKKFHTGIHMRLPVGLVYIF